MNAQDLKNSILQLAIQGKLVEQRQEEVSAKELIKEIKAEKERLIKEKKIKKEKPLAEITEDEVPFEIPESWEWVRLNSLTLFIKAGGDKPKDFSGVKTETHTIPVIANGIQNDGIIGYTQVATVDEPCITVSGRGTIGFSCIRTEPFCPIVRLLVLNVSKEVSQKYIQIVLTALLEKGVGTSIQQLTVPMLEPKLIPIPPLEEQKRIVAKIEEIMPYIEKYGTAHSKLEIFNKKFPEDMQKSILQYAIQGKLVEQREEEGTAEELYKYIQEEKEKLIKEKKIKREKPLPEITEDEVPFEIPESWKWVRLDNISYKIGDIDHKMPPVVEGGYPYISPVNFTSNGIDYDNAKTIGKEDFDNLSKKIKPTRNDIIFPRYGTIGVVRMVETDREFLVSYSCCTIKNFQEYVLSQYIFYVLQSGLIKSEINRYINKTTQPNIGLASIKRFLIPLPPLAEQKRIVAKIEEMLPHCKQLVK
ncbi:restriction endonuclease subunit S [Clostridium beijerinckii]|uniref:restriction endonuclease subunit S n=1 Tax=Clostridium beijerinckii TaxID=1520 RepID=UPI00242F6BC0|nr:restriction endonuclease subunit S [Clostridium beijerinckii]MDG5854911.1 restriction endonuclease subunit S [Clostridium beijerinckii]